MARPLPLPVAALALLLAGLLSAAGPAEAAGDPPPARVASARIVSAGGSVTEVIYALGAGDRLLAVDSTSLYPAAAAALPNIGYLRSLAAEPIVAMTPDLLLVEADAGPPAVLDQIASAGVPVIRVADEPSPQGVLEKVSAVAAALGLEAEGQALGARLSAGFAEAAARVAGLERRPKVLFLLSIGNGGAPLAAGRDTSAARMIELAGGVNALDAFEGFKPLSPEAAVAARPDVLLVTDRSAAALGGADALLARPEIAPTPAGKAKRIVVMDGLLLLGFGPRTPEAIERLAAALHPGLSAVRQQ